MRLGMVRIGAAAVLAVGILGGTTPAVEAAAKANAVDRAFVRQMIPHHEMAIEMANMVEMQGAHAKLKTAAKEIVDDQTAEIATLKRIAQRLGVTPGSVDDHEQMMRDADTLHLSMDEMGMSMDMDELDGAKPFDRKFIDMMILHHQGAIRMAYAERDRGKDSHLRKIARSIIISQSEEIRQMNRWRKQWYGSTSPSGGVPED
jgi:uncharacterized protein (DUF305 family)